MSKSIKVVTEGAGNPFALSGSSPPEYESEKVFCIVDGQNLSWGAQDQRISIDYRKLDLILCGGSRGRTYLYNSAQDPEYAIQNKHYRYIQNHLGWIVKLFKLGKKTVKCTDCGSRRISSCEKGVDVAIATKMLELAATRNCKKIILISGDADFCDTINTVQTDFGVPVQIVSWRKSLSQQLVSVAKVQPIILDDILHRIEQRAS